MEIRYDLGRAYAHFKHVKFEFLEGYLNDNIREKVIFRKG